MNDAEATAVLDAGGQNSSELLLEASGWPAVLGLAALSGSSAPPTNKLPLACTNTSPKSFIRPPIPKFDGVCASWLFRRPWTST